MGPKLGPGIGAGWLGSDLDLASFVADVWEQQTGVCVCVCVCVGSAGRENKNIEEVGFNFRVGQRAAACWLQL